MSLALVATSPVMMAVEQEYREQEVVIHGKELHVDKVHPVLPVTPKKPQVVHTIKKETVHTTVPVHATHIYQHETMAPGSSGIGIAPKSHVHQEKSIIKKVQEKVAPVITQAHKKLEHVAHNLSSRYTPSWQAHIAAGYGWTTPLGITKNPDVFYWDEAVQGYDANVGDTQFIQLGVDRQFGPDRWLGVAYQVGAEVNSMQDMHYRKYQTGTDLATEDSALSRMRSFDISHMSVLAHAQAQKEWSAKYFRFAPMVEIGVGVGINRVYNFHTVAYKQNIAGIDSGIGAGIVTSVGADASSTAGLAWQVGAGVQLRPMYNDDVTVQIGYRYYIGGSIVTPSRIMLNNDDLGIGQGKLAQVSKPWEGCLAMHQLVVGLDIAF